MASVTYIKFMTKEELVTMLTQIHRFELKDETGNTITLDKRVFKPEYIEFNDIVICDRAPAFKLSAFDMIDVLISGEGYVRYNTWFYGNRENSQAKLLKEFYGFEEEN